MLLSGNRRGDTSRVQERYLQALLDAGGQLAEDKIVDGLRYRLVTHDGQRHLFVNKEKVDATTHHTT